MKLLVAYATTDGMTARIATRFAETARSAGSDVDVLDCRSLPANLNPDGYDGVVVGASMHAQGYQHAAKRFVRRYRGALSSRPSAFVSVCLSIASKNADERADSRRIADRFTERLGWKPDFVEIVAGALMFSRYGMLRRLAMKAIAKKEMGSVDPSCDTVFTDWAAVDRFARDFVGFVAERTSRSTPIAATAQSLASGY